MVASPRQAWQTTLAMLAVSVAVAGAYWPGLSGVFLFDDFINLDALGRYGGVRDWNTFLYFLTSGTADPTGRPVSQLSFLLDATDWPADPWPFKRTNLLIHLLNGWLLLVLIRRMERWLPPSESTVANSWVPLLACVLWIAHPLWVSTTLYVVQRQAMLAATFTLLGLLAWDKAYRHWRSDRTWRGWGWLVFGVGGCTLMAGLSKANGFLLPLLALVIWWTLQSRDEDGLGSLQRRRLRWSVALALGPPVLALLGFLVQQVPAAAARALAIRDWTLAERLLSQPRAIWDYLSVLALPREGSGGVFADGFVASRGLLEPATTLPALVGLLALLALALKTRKNHPRLSTAFMFFLTGHLLESGPLPLELYFEHRNYVPALLLGWPLANALLAPGPARRARLGLAMAVPLVWLGLTWQRSMVWGNPPLQAAIWAERNQDSPRAQGYAANWLQRQGRMEEARILLERGEARTPGQSDIALNRVAEGCSSGHIEEDAVAAAVRATRTLSQWNQGTIDWFERFQLAVLRGDCTALGLGGWARLRAALEANPDFVRAPPRRQVLARMEGRRALAMGKPDEALDAYDRGLELDPRPELALAQAADLGNAGYPDQGLRHLDRYLAMNIDPAPDRIRDMGALHRWILARTGYYRRELDVLGAALGQAGAEARNPRRQGENEHRGNRN